MTLNKERKVIENGAIAVEDKNIVAIGQTEAIKNQYSAKKVIDATNHAVLPGFISAHAHVSDILLRGGVGTDRKLFDWLFNLRYPGDLVMDAEDYAIGSALYCQEAIQSGITLFVENDAGIGLSRIKDLIESKLNVYDAAGMRNVYARAFQDTFDPDFKCIVKFQMAKEPSVKHGTPDEAIMETGEALHIIESLIKKYHGNADGRQSIWPAPLYLRVVTDEGLIGAYRLAEKYDLMTTTHVSEIPQQDKPFASGVEYLNNINYLGKRALLNHCVHLSNCDIRLLSTTGTHVAHNPVTNLALGSGIAPVPTMMRYGVNVALGTDNTSASDTVNIINDMRFAALIHKGYHQDAGIMTAEKVLEMATIDGARAVGKENELGSLEPGKKADIVLLDLSHAHLTPHPNVVSAIVYQAQGFEVDTVVCNGKIIMENRRVHGIDDLYPNLIEQSNQMSEEIFERAGISKMRNRPWTSI